VPQIPMPMGRTDQLLSYDRTPPCSLGLVTMCNQFFHDIQITGLKEGTSYYYQLQAANGTTESDIMTFTTALAAGKNEEFTVAMINDMGVSLHHLMARFRRSSAKSVGSTSMRKERTRCSRRLSSPVPHSHGTEVTSVTLMTSISASSVISCLLHPRR
jgi:hypothetical protein